MAKRITDKSLSCGLPTVALFREDLEHILELLTTAAEDSGSSVTIRDREFVYESLDDLQAQRGDKVKELMLKTENPYVSTELQARFGGTGGSLFAVGTEAKAIYHDIYALMQQRKRWFIPFITYPFALVWWCLLMCLVLIVFRLPTLWSVIVMLVIPIPIAFTFVATMSPYGGLSKISLLKRHEQPSFFVRNSDHILVALITAVLTTGITAPLTWYFSTVLPDRSATQEKPVDESPTNEDKLPIKK